MPSLTTSSANSELVEWILSGYIGGFLGWAGKKLAGLGAEIIPTPNLSERRSTMRVNEQELKQLFADALVCEDVGAQAHTTLGVYLRHGLILIKSGALSPNKWKQELTDLRIQAEWAKEGLFIAALREWEEQLDILIEKQSKEYHKNDTDLISYREMYEQKQVAQSLEKKTTWFSFPMAEAAWNPFKGLGRAIKAIFSPADFFMPNDSIKELIEKAREEGQLLIGEVGSEARLTVQETGRIFDGVIEKASKHANELVINMGNEGRLFITKINEEFRFSADHVLENIMGKSQIILEAGGLEARLTIQEAGKVANIVTQTAGLELRSIITHAGNEYRAISYEMPKLLRLGAESIVAGFLQEAKAQIWGETPLDNTRRKISNYVRENQDISLKHLLNYVKKQNQSLLEPQDKAKLYADLISYINDPNHPEDKEEDTTWEQLQLIIGTVALNDPALFRSVEGWFSSYTEDYTQPILDSISNPLMKMALQERDENKILDFLGLAPVPKIESDGSVPIGTIVAFPSHIVPDNFAECDGREYPVEDFPDLYEVLGNRYGYRIDDTGRKFFQVPDYRGYFLRGWEQGGNEDRSELLLGAAQEDSTRMPNLPFQVELSEKHTHSMKLNGAHTHEVEVSGEHEHITESTGEHKHDIDEIANHSHDIDSAGIHSHITHKDGQHTHKIEYSANHTHDSIDGWDIRDGRKKYLIAQHVSVNYLVTPQARGVHPSLLGGSHTHTIHKDDGHTHPIESDGSHTHKIHNNGGHSHTMQLKGEHVHKIASSGAHTHTVQKTESHTHELEQAGEHTHILTGGDKETRPKNVQVKFMIKYKSSARNLHQEIKELKEELEATRVEMSKNYQSGFFYSAVATSLSVAAIISNTCLNYLKR